MALTVDEKSLKNGVLSLVVTLVEVIEEYAPCPDCNQLADTSFMRPDNSVFRSPDPEKVREMMRR